MKCFNIKLNRIAGCRTCRHHESCKGGCRSDSIGCHRFSVSKERLEEANRERLDEILTRIGGLNNVSPSQIELGMVKDYAEFNSLPKSVLKSNSRNWKKTKVDDVTFEGFCEQCGEKFETVNDTRLLCDECWAEICGKLGVVYGRKTAGSGI